MIFKRLQERNSHQITSGTERADVILKHFEKIDNEKITPEEVVEVILEIVKKYKKTKHLS